MRLAEIHAELPPLEQDDPSQDTPAEPASPYYTPSGHYYASQSDAAFWTKVENERAERDAARRAAYAERVQRGEFF